jgi:hypothetical protein
MSWQDHQFTVDASGGDPMSTSIELPPPDPSNDISSAELMAGATEEEKEKAKNLQKRR